MVHVFCFEYVVDFFLGAAHLKLGISALRMCFLRPKR